MSDIDKGTEVDFKNKEVDETGQDIVSAGESQTEMSAAATAQPTSADPDISDLLNNGVSVEEIVKHNRLSRTLRDDYTAEMIISNHEDGKLGINCHRCYRLKKKCLREYPACEYCLKTGHDCFYVDRRKSKDNFNSAYIKYDVNQRKLEKEQTIIKEKQESSNSKGINPTSCTRCFRLKRKCSRTYPKCVHCIRTNNDCIYDKTKKYRTSKFDQLVEVALDKGSPESSEEESMDEPSEPIFKQVEYSDNSVNRILVKSLNPPMNQDDYVNLKSIDDSSLPATFVDNFFFNYSFIYPILKKEDIVKEIEACDFSAEVLINLKLYLILSIGCLITDSISNASNFSSIFNESIIESMIDSINFNEFDIDSMNLMILLIIYYINKKNFLITWNLIGITNRLIIKFDIFRLKNPSEQIKNMFIAIYNIDKDVSFILNKPSQFLQDEYCGLMTSENDLISKFNELYKLENKINCFKLTSEMSKSTLSQPKSDTLKKLSNEIENWRVSISGLLHINFNSQNLQEFTTLINLNYFYLCIELDELSDLKSSQFILQFLSQFFALVLSDNHKTNIGLSMKNLVHFEKLIQVIKYNLNNLESYKSFGYIENFQLIINLLKYFNNQAGQANLKSLIDLCINFNDQLRDYNENINIKECKRQIICELSCLSLV